MSRSEAGRWYSAEEHKCILEIPKKNGKGMKKPTIADAAKLGLFPSVTTIMTVTAKPGLEKWKQAQVLMAALTLPKIAGESDEAYIDRILDDAHEQVEQACETGKDFHAAAEMYWQGKVPDTDNPAIIAFLGNLHAWRQEKEAEGWRGWITELPVFNLEEGYAGTPDLRATKQTASGVAVLVADYKTCDLSKLKPTKDNPKPTPTYDEHKMQIAAGLGALDPFAEWHGEELYVDKNTGELRVHVWSREDLCIGSQMFEACHTLWNLSNRWSERQKEQA